MTLKKGIAAILLIMTTWLQISCSSDNHHPTSQIITSSWIGYSPIYYAKEMGWLDELNIELSSVISLGEATVSFQSGYFDMITGTQFEYHRIEKNGQLITPVMLLDRSNGGDVIMSNRSLEALKSEQGDIQVYLEMNSVNFFMLNDFIAEQQLQDKSLKLSHSNHLKTLNTLQNQPPEQPTIVVTYSPYDESLAKIDFEILASTATSDSILVVDALFVRNDFLKQHPKTVSALKVKIQQAILALEEDTQNYYKKVRPYLGEMTYPEFIAGLKRVEWIHQNTQPELLQKLEKYNFDTSQLTQP